MKVPKGRIICDITHISNSNASSRWVTCPLQREENNKSAS